MEDEIVFPLSPKYKDFLKYEASAEFLEGTTSAGKTTVATPKFMFKVARSPKKLHIMSGLDLGTIEKNIINKDNGLLDIFGEFRNGGLAEYNSSGRGIHSLPHILYHTPNGVKVIYVVGYDNKARWKKILGGQYGCILIDEFNIADMDFVREIFMRCDYRLCTMNPDDPNKECYSQYVNKSRPLEKYKNDTPIELLKMLDQPQVNDWTHWYFTFDDNASLTEEKKRDIISTTPIGTKLHKNKILGLRGKATGLCFNLESKNIITVEEAKKLKFKIFSVGCDTSYSKETHDKVTIEGIGITIDGKCVLLKERTYNNKDRTIPFAPSDVVQWIVEFMEEFKNEWGFARTCFIDSADQGTIMEAQKAKRQNNLIYNFENAWKKTKVITRVQLQESWLGTGDFLVVETCKDYINECDVYSFGEDNQPEDANDHSIQGGQYAWLPYKKKIGNWEVIKKIIKDDMEE